MESTLKVRIFFHRSKFFPLISTPSSQGWRWSSSFALIYMQNQRSFFYATAFWDRTSIHVGIMTGYQCKHTPPFLPHNTTIASGLNRLYLFLFHLVDSSLYPFPSLNLKCKRRIISGQDNTPISAWL